MENFVLQKKISERQFFDADYVPVRLTGTVKNAISIYQKLSIPKTVLIDDYFCLCYYKTGATGAYNPFKYWCKVKNINIETGISVHESALEKAAVILAKKEPTEIVRSVFYANSKRNDSKIENHYIMDTFFGEITGTEDILIVNPAPDFLVDFEKRRKNIGAVGKNIYVVADKTIAKIYGFQFPEAQFLAFPDDAADIAVDKTLIITRDIEVDKIGELMRWLQCCRTNAYVFVANAFMENNKNFLFGILKKNCLHIEKAVIVDSKIVNSSPKKKSFLVLKKQTSENHFFELFSSSYENNKFVINGSSYIIDDRFWRENFSLISLSAKCENFLKSNKVVKKYAKAASLFLSNEIQLRYQIYEKNGKFCGRLWYCQLLDLERLKWGKAVTPKIESGLRGESADQVRELLAEKVFDDRIYWEVKSDLSQKFLCEGKKLSLTSLWIYVYSDLKNEKNYDHKLTCELFFEKVDFSEVMPSELSNTYLLQLLKNNFGENYEQYRDQLALIFEVCAKKELVKYNVFQEFVFSKSQRAEKAKNQVRNAFRKKEFTKNEEDRIMDFLMQKIPNEFDEYNQSRCVVDGFYLIGFIRLFTGISLREACALLWRDIQRIGDTGACKLRVYKYVDKNGNFSSYFGDDLKKIRLIPINALLKRVLASRWRLLEKMNIDLGDKSLIDMPIWFDKQRLVDLVKKKEGNGIKMHNAVKVCRDIINKAQIEERLLILPDFEKESLTDVNKYNGDIFSSNFEMKLKNKCGFTLDEINYLRGRTQADTLGNHYLDYSNDFVQILILEKYNRWTYRYHERYFALAKKTENQIWQTTYKEISSDGDCECTEIFLSNISKDTCILNLEINVNAGCDVQIKIYD